MLQIKKKQAYNFYLHFICIYFNFKVHCAYAQYEVIYCTVLGFESKCVWIHIKRFSPIEFWSSHLNFRGPREAPKPQNDKKQKPDAPQAAPPQQGLTAQPESAGLRTAPEPDTSGSGAALQPDQRPTLLDEFFPIRTRSPKDLDCGAGQGALCFVNPLFLQPEGRLSRHRSSKHSLKVRVSMETSTMLSPPLAPPPPPPVLPKAKRGQARGPAAQEQLQLPATSPGPWAGDGDGAQADDSDYLQPSPAINLTLSPYLSPSATATLFPRGPPSLSPHDSPADSPSLSPYQSPSVSPKLSRSPGITSPVSPYQSPSPSPKIPFSLSPFTSPSFVHLAEQAYHTPATAAASRSDQQGAVDREAGRADQDNGTRLEENEKGDDGEVEEEVLSINAARLDDTDSCNFFSSL